jgi:hypothetical protein
LRDRTFNGLNRILISLVKRPLLNALASEETNLREDLQMLRDRGVADAELARDEQSANAVFDEIAVALGREVALGVFQPLQNLETAMVAERLDGLSQVHFINEENDEMILPYFEEMESANLDHKTKKRVLAFRWLPSTLCGSDYRDLLNMVEL